MVYIQETKTMCMHPNTKKPYRQQSYTVVYKATTHFIKSYKATISSAVRPVIFAIMSAEIPSCFILRAVER